MPRALFLELLCRKVRGEPPSFRDIPDEYKPLMPKRSIRARLEWEDMGARNLDKVSPENAAAYIKTTSSTKNN